MATIKVMNHEIEKLNHEINEAKWYKQRLDRLQEQYNYYISEEEKYKIKDYNNVSVSTIKKREEIFLEFKQEILKFLKDEYQKVNDKIEKLSYEEKRYSSTLNYYRENSISSCIYQMNDNNRYDYVVQRHKDFYFDIHDFLSSDKDFLVLNTGSKLKIGKKFKHGENFSYIVIFTKQPMPDYKDRLFPSISTLQLHIGKNIRDINDKRMDILKSEVLKAYMKYHSYKRSELRQKIIIPFTYPCRLESTIGEEGYTKGGKFGDHDFYEEQIYNHNSILRFLIVGIEIDYNFFDFT